MAYGKIARLPRELREQMNRRLMDNEPGKQLAAWLNGLPEVQAVLAEHFGGREINEGNISEWKKAGHQTWLAQQELRQCARDLAEDAKELKAAGEGQLAEHLAVVVGAKYAKLLQEPGGEAGEGFERRLRVLGQLNRQVVALRRSEHSAGRLRVQAARAEHAKSSSGIKALEFCLDEADKYPEVQAALKAAFAMLKERSLAVRIK